MSMGLPLYTSIGTGTLTTAMGAATLMVTPNANTLAGDLIVLVGYIAATDNNLRVDLTKDAGDGWRLIGYAGDWASGISGGIMAACIAPRHGSANYVGMSFVYTGLSPNYVCQNQTYRLTLPGIFALGLFSTNSPGAWAFLTGTALDAPGINQPYQQVIDLIGRTYYNNGTTTTVAAVTNFTERFDTGQATNPAAGVVLNDRTNQITGSVQNPLVTSALAVAKIERSGCRAMIPIVGHTSPHPGRYGRWRRLS
jgi:hypothetical protein